MIDKILAFISTAQNKLREVFMASIQALDKAREVLKKLKEWLGIIALLLLISSSLHAFSLFDGLYKKIDDNRQQTYQLANEVSAVKELNASLVGRVDKLSLQLSVNAEATAKAQAAMQAGFNNSVENVSKDIRARDMNNSGNNTQTNDSRMIMTIFKLVLGNIGKIVAGLFTFILTLMGGVWAALRAQAEGYEKTIAAKDKQITLLTKLFQEADEYADKVNADLVKTLLGMLQKEGVKPNENQ